MVSRGSVAIMLNSSRATGVHEKRSILCKARNGQGHPAATAAAEIHIGTVSSVQLALLGLLGHSEVQMAVAASMKGVRVTSREAL